MHLLRALAFLVAFFPPASIRAANWAKLSPFTRVQCQERSATVEFNGHEYDLIAINDWPVAEILDFSRQQFRGQWKRRFTEDLVEVLATGKHPMSDEQTVKLALKETGTGKVVVVEKASMTAENRASVYRSLHDETAGAQPADESLPALDLFEKTLRGQWAYFRVGNADFETPLRALRERLRARPMPSGEFALELQKIIALGIDGHAGVEGLKLPGGCLPFLIEPSGDRFVAFHPDRHGFLDTEFPFIARLDGKPIQQWLDAVAILVPKGSPQYVRRHCLRVMRNVQFARQQLRIAADQDLQVELESSSGSKRTLQLPVARELPTHGVWPPAGSKILDGNIGYLRLPGMDEKAVEEIRAWMPRFRETKALVVDVRGNGGGSRDALLQLFSYLSALKNPPKVANAAMYRLAPTFGPDHLQSRFLFPESSSTWKPAEREAIASFKTSFHPQWTPPAGEFSEWHYLVLNRLDDPAIFHYSRPVAVLMDGKCFSATDIFLASLKGLPSVRLIGTPSGGGSARPMKIRLTPSISVSLASMVSFQADGTLFDGHGIAPNIVAEPNPEFFIGGRDAVLERALSTLDSDIRPAGQ